MVQDGFDGFDVVSCWRNNRMCFYCILYMSRSWKQNNTRNKKVYLGLHTPLHVDNITTSGTTIFNTNINNSDILYVDVSDNLLTVQPISSINNNINFNKESNSIISINSNASFQGSIQGADASFQNIGASSGNGGFLNIVNDVSFQRSIRGTDASFQNIGASDGNGSVVKIVNDVSFQGSIHGTDASFQNIGASDGILLNIVNDVSFQGSIQGTDASFQNIGASDGSILKILDDVSFQGSISCTDVSFQRIGTIHGSSLEVVNNVLLSGPVLANRASFASMKPYSTNKITFTDTKFDFSNNTKHALISDVLINFSGLSDKIIYNN